MTDALLPDEALERLLAACEDSDDMRYGTLSTSFVANICRAALSRSAVPPEPALLREALRDAWAGFVNLGADMEPGPLRQQLHKHAQRANAVLDATYPADPPMPKTLEMRYAAPVDPSPAPERKE